MCIYQIHIFSCKYPFTCPSYTASSAHDGTKNNCSRDFKYFMCMSVVGSIGSRLKSFKNATSLTTNSTLTFLWGMFKNDC